MSSVSETGAEPESENRPSPARRGRLMAVFAIVGIACIAIDTVTKMLVVANLSPGEPVRLLGGAIYLTLTRNSGAAFSLATDYTAALATLGVLVVIGIGIFAWKRLGSMPWAFALGFIAGGAMGNLVDRIFRAPGFMTGEVVDFISLFHPYGKGWAIFNLADSALCVGVVLVVLLELTGRRIDGTRATKSDRGGAK